MTNNSDNRIVVALHVGRGGRFHNPGHKEYKGEINFMRLCNSQTQYLNVVNRDENGRFCRPYLIEAYGYAKANLEANGMIGEEDGDEEV